MKNYVLVCMVHSIAQNVEYKFVRIRLYCDYYKS